MTNREALQAELQNIVVTDTAIDKALIDQAVSMTDTYTVENGKDIARAAINVLQSMLGSQDIQEGGFSVSMRSTTIPLRIQALARKWNFIDVLAGNAPTIQSACRW